MAENAKSKQTIDQLKRRFEKLNAEKIRAGAQLEGAEKHLARLQQQARDEFGTEDLDELRNKLRQMEEENERRRAAYQESLDAIDADLETVAARYGDADDGAGNGTQGRN